VIGSSPLDFVLGSSKTGDLPVDEMERKWKEECGKFQKADEAVGSG